MLTCIYSRRLPSIAESIAHLERTDPISRSRTDEPQQSRSRFDPRRLATRSFNVSRPTLGRSPQSNPIPDSSSHSTGRRDHTSSHVSQTSPMSDGFFSQSNSRPSTASSSPRSRSSPRTSRASSLTSLSQNDDVRNDDDGLVVSESRVERICKTLEKIFNYTPSERASDSRVQHKIAEQRRRAEHKKLYEVQKDLSKPVLIRLKDPNANCYQEGLPPHLVRAMLTGNHKNYDTKTAIHIAQIVQVLHQSARITSLEEELRRVYDILEAADIYILRPHQFNYLVSRTSKL